jgi:predicted amidohydrolase YtcJ
VVGGVPGDEGWFPEQRLSMQETIHAFTVAAAYTAGQEARQGTISPGKLADLTIYDRDIFEVAPEELLETRIAGTMIGGEFRYRNF